MSEIAVALATGSVGDAEPFKPFIDYSDHLLQGELELGGLNTSRQLLHDWWSQFGRNRHLQLEVLTVSGNQFLLEQSFLENNTGVGMGIKIHSGEIIAVHHDSVRQKVKQSARCEAL